MKEEAVKLTKKYFNKYKKIVKLMQQTILQRKKINSSKSKNNRELHFYRFQKRFQQELSELYILYLCCFKKCRSQIKKSTIN